MQNKQILFPVLAMVFLAWGVLQALRHTRFGAIKRAGIKPGKLSDPAVFAEVMSPAENISDNFENLFEMPVLFYLAAILIFILQATDWFYVVTAWIFVFFRYLHSYIHCTYNRTVHRFSAFFVSCVFLLLIWIRLGYQLIFRF